MKNEDAAHRHPELSTAVRVILSDKHLGEAVLIRIRAMFWNRAGCRLGVFRADRRPY